MKYSIIGAGNIGTALARSFERKNVAISIANSRGPETIEPLAQQLGGDVTPVSLQEALDADMIFVAVPFAARNSVAAQRSDWSGKIIVDAMNAFPAPGELGDRLSSEVVQEAFAGARVVKAFNHLPAAQLGTSQHNGWRQAVFVSSDHADASATVAEVATQLGFAPIELGRLDEGGVALHFRGGVRGGLIFQNLFKSD